jgi:glycine cleavage system H protein
MKTPKNLFYTKEHEWADFKDDEVIIGITDYAQGQLGDVIFIEFPDIGEKFNSGDIFGEVEAVKTVSELYLPISGTITKINESLEDNPESVNSEPYGKGWLVKISPENFNDRAGLISSEEYEALIN